LCIRGYLVKQTGDSDSFQNPFSKQDLLFPKEKTGGIVAHEDTASKKTRVLTMGLEALQM